VNLYPSGDAWLVPHKDGVGDCVCIITLGSHTLLEFRNYTDRSPPAFTEVLPQPADEEEAANPLWPEARPVEASLWLRHGSLVVLRDDAFKGWAHGITAQCEDRFEPTSLANGEAILHESSRAPPALDSVHPRGRRISLVLWSNLPSN